MRVCLDVVAGGDFGKQFEYEGFQSFVVGRGVRHDTGTKAPRDPYMSRHHFMLIMTHEECVLRDLASSNGTFLNGKKVGGDVRLRDGDTIKAGRTVLRVLIRAPVPGDTVLPPVQTRGLEDFEIQGRIGVGSFSRVERALDKRSGDVVALKRLRLGVSDDQRAVLHFLREMKIVEKLRHPYIVETIATGRDRDELWLAMEYVPGESLDARIQRSGRLTEAAVLAIARQVLEALDFAHARGFVHRDVKPANVLLRSSGNLTAKLADFGLARCYSDPGATCLTSSGYLKGTPTFMPKEQVLDARRVGPAADLFAVGATMYYALTKSWHFPGEGRNPWAMILNGEPIPLRKRIPTANPALAAVVDRALRSEPGERFPTARAMRDALP